MIKASFFQYFLSYVTFFCNEAWNNENYRYTTQNQWESLKGGTYIFKALHQKRRTQENEQVASCKLPHVCAFL